MCGSMNPSNLKNEQRRSTIRCRSISQTSSTSRSVLFYSRHLSVLICTAPTPCARKKNLSIHPLTECTSTYTCVQMRSNADTQFCNLMASVDRSYITPSMYTHAASIFQHFYIYTHLYMYEYMHVYIYICNNTRTYNYVYLLHMSISLIQSLTLRVTHMCMF